MVFLLDYVDIIAKGNALVKRLKTICCALPLFLSKISNTIPQNVAYFIMSTLHIVRFVSNFTKKFFCKLVETHHT